MRELHVRTTTFGDPAHPGGEGFIRPARDEDAPALARFMPAAFPLGSDEAAQYGSVEALRLMIFGFDSPTAREAHFTFLVAERAGAVLGGLIFRYGMHSNDPFEAPVYLDVGILDTLAVDPLRRSVGIGRGLVRRAEADMRAAGARVMTLQCPITAAGFYQRCGYHVENPEIACLTFFPRQGQKVFTASRPAGEIDTRLAWRTLTGAKVSGEPYTHPSRGEPAMMIQGAIPGDRGRMRDWPAPSGFKLVGSVLEGPPA